MSPEEALYRSLTRNRSGHPFSSASEPTTDAERVQLLSQAYGPGAASLIGVHPATWRRWRAGHTRPGAKSRPMLQRAADRVVRRQRLGAGRERRLRAADRVRVTAVWHVSSDVRHRTITFTLDPGVMDDVVNYYLAGADDLAWQVFDQDVIRNEVSAGSPEFESGCGKRPACGIVY